MFKLANNTEIGPYIDNLIQKKGISGREFCRKYLKLKYPNQSDEERADSVDNLNNRLTQIKHGNKSIQVYDLPIFCELLDVSCEELLSAGQSFSPTSSHLTNYDVAFSNDKSVWDKYIAREDKLILNADEYNKTVIDYALEFKNYPFLKYLMDKKYIWFTQDDRKQFAYTFGAGTSIKRRKPGDIDILEVHLNTKGKDSLRRKMISLAIENNDFDMLTTLKAREIPMLYDPDYIAFEPVEFRSYYDEELIHHVVHSNQKVITYFTKEFSIDDRFGTINYFMFPFMSELVDKLIKTRNKYLDNVLRRCIAHNKRACNMIISSFNKAQKYYENDSPMGKYQFKMMISQHLQHFDYANAISLRNLTKDDESVFTNFVHIQAKTKDEEIAGLIEEVNKYYHFIVSLKKQSDNQEFPEEDFFALKDEFFKQSNIGNSNNCLEEKE
ncbi:MAG: hypothetical protein IJG23_06705 [Clostridia bacterium]|nr:hypothetical protein [Clostridia bacterium]